MTIKLNDAIKNRRSVRLFLDKKASQEQIRAIIESANYAPSACNRQAWRFIVVDDKEKLSLLSDLGGAHFIKKSPQAILIVYSNLTDNFEYQDHIQSASAAIQNMQLKIFSLGLGSCWIDNLPNKTTVRKIFSIPKTYDPIALVVFGYPKIEPKPIRRKLPVEKIMSRNSFDFADSESKSNVYKIIIRKYLRKIYISSPNFLKKTFLPIVRKFEKRDFS